MNDLSKFGHKKLQKFLFYLLRASSLVSWVKGSKVPVSKLILEARFFNSPSPTFTSSSKFFFVATSTEETSPLNVSSCLQFNDVKKIGRLKPRIFFHWKLSLSANAWIVPEYGGIYQSEELQILLKDGGRPCLHLPE